MSHFPAHERWTPTTVGLVHAYAFGSTATDRLPDRTVVAVPGLGLPQYLRPLAEDLAQSGRPCVIMDLPGLAGHVPKGRSHGSAPDIEAVGAAVAAWVRAHHREGALTLMGHSTGAQGALAAALALQPDAGHQQEAVHQQEAGGLAVVLAGPTFTPQHRRAGRLVAAALRAYRQDSLRELVVLPTLARHPAQVLALVQSGMRDAPEQRVTRLTAPVVLTAGEADSFAPEPWLRELAERSAGPAQVRVEAGSHNNPFTHPRSLGDVVRAAERLVTEAG